MKNQLIALALVASLGLAACANTGASYRPINDGPVGVGYQSDLTQCQRLATERRYMNGDTRNKALAGAGLGAIAGLADDDTNDTEGAIAGAIVGALVGSGQGAAEAHGERRQIVIQCMRGRGHRVVG